MYAYVHVVFSDEDGRYVYRLVDIRVLIRMTLNYTDENVRQDGNKLLLVLDTIPRNLLLLPIYWKRTERRKFIVDFSKFSSYIRSKIKWRKNVNVWEIIVNSRLQSSNTCWIRSSKKCLNVYHDNLEHFERHILKTETSIFTDTPWFLFRKISTVSISNVICITNINGSHYSIKLSSNLSPPTRVKRAKRYVLIDKHRERSHTVEFKFEHGHRRRISRCSKLSETRRISEARVYTRKRRRLNT